MKKEVLTRPLGDRIWMLRRRKNLTQQELGELSDLSFRVIGEIERGEKTPTMHDLSRISRALGIETKEMILGLEMTQG